MKFFVGATIATAITEAWNGPLDDQLGAFIVVGSVTLLWVSGIHAVLNLFLN